MKCCVNVSEIKPEDILFSDGHVCIVVKPAGIVVQSSPSEKDTLEDRLRLFLRKTLGKDTIYLVAVHRLDRPVAGPVLFARSSKALVRLQRLQKERKIQKYYLAVTEGIPAPRRGRLRHYLEKEEHRTRVVTKGGKEALSDYRVVAVKGDRALVYIRLHTGRYHQIRAQFSASGCPILGDRKYGSRAPFTEKGIALCHAKLIFTHPVTREVLVIRFTDFKDIFSPACKIFDRPAGRRSFSSKRAP